MENKYFKDDLVFPNTYLFCNVFNKYIWLFELKSIHFSRKNLNKCLPTIFLLMLIYLHNYTTRKTLILSFENHLFAFLVTETDKTPLTSIHYLIHSINIYGAFSMCPALFQALIDRVGAGKRRGGNTLPL